MEKEWQTAFKCDLTRIKKTKTKKKQMKDIKRNKTKHTILYTLREQR